MTTSIEAYHSDVFHNANDEYVFSFAIGSKSDGFQVMDITAIKAESITGKPEFRVLGWVPQNVEDDEKKRDAYGRSPRISLDVAKAQLLQYDYETAQTGAKPLVGDALRAFRDGLKGRSHFQEAIHYEDVADRPASSATTAPPKALPG